MKIEITKQAVYHATCGPLPSKGGGLREETLQLWEKVKKFAIDEYIILTPEKDANLVNVRARIAGNLARLLKQMSVSFNVRVVLHRREGHVVIQKIPRKA